MDTESRSLLHRIFVAMRRSGNRSLRRIRKFAARRLILFSDRLAMRSDASSDGRIRHKIIETTANLGYGMREYPGPMVWRVDGCEFAIAYLGPRSTLGPICRLFGNDFHPLALGRTQFRQSARCASGLLDEGYDLVIVETNNKAFEVPDSLLQFSIPVWLNQKIALEKPLSELVAGNKRQVIRRRIRKFQDSGMTLCITRQKQDFHLFYHQLYLPFVTARHGSNAVIAPYDVQWRLWLKPKSGRLFLIKRGDALVAGMICAVVGDTCHSIEGGVLTSDEELYRRGIWTYLNATIIDWAYAYGLRWYNFGGSRPWLTDPVFESKRRWGTRVAARLRPTNNWTIAARQMTTAMQACCNSLGLISELDGDHFAVLIDSNGDVSDANYQTRAARAGLQGVKQFSSVDGEMKIIRNEDSSTYRY